MLGLSAVGEGFFATTKREPINRRPWTTITHLCAALFDRIEGWYNARRLHSSLGYLSATQSELEVHRL